MPEFSTDMNMVYNQKIFDYNIESDHTITVDLPVSVRRNGSLYLHLFLTSTKVDSEVSNYL